MEQVAIVDFGSQTTHLISQRLRRMGIEAKVILPETALEESQHCAGIILSGGPASVYGENAPQVPLAIFDRNVPILGICYGWQFMAHALGGEVKSGWKEYGIERVKLNELSIGIPSLEFSAVVSHGDTVSIIPPGFKILGSTEKVFAAAALHPEKKWLGVQFHPEAKHTDYGPDLLAYFAEELCGISSQPHALDPEIVIQKIKDTVGNAEVICAVSGGVDSTVAAFLLTKAIGKQMHPIYVDSSLMRPGTREKVEEIFSESQLHVVDAKQRFLDALKDVEDPEQKRAIVGKLYVDIFQEIASELHNVAYLAQGTIYSDVIESKGTTHAAKIKSHHNVGGLPASLNLKLIEPVRDYYKDEVRELGLLAGLPEKYIKVHPFPGPGYAIRIRGAVDEKRLSQVQQADMIILEELDKAGLYDEVFQCFAVMTGAYSTAVKGDGRAFEEVVAIRAYESTDVMTATWAKLPYPFLEKVARRIVSEVPNISRVVYDITEKPPATMEWE